MEGTGENMAEGLFDESILTDVQQALEALLPIEIKKYVDLPTPSFLPETIKVHGNFTTSENNENEKLPTSTPTGGRITLAYLTLKENGLYDGSNKLSKQDRVMFCGKEYEITAITPTSFIVLNGVSIPALFSISVQCMDGDWD